MTYAATSGHCNPPGFGSYDAGRDGADTAEAEVADSATDTAADVDVATDSIAD